MLLVRVIQGAGPCTGDRTNASPYSTCRQATDRGSAGRANADALYGIDVAFVSNVAPVRMVGMVVSYSAKIGHCWSNQQSPRNDSRNKKSSHWFVPHLVDDFCPVLVLRSIEFRG